MQAVSASFVDLPAEFEAVEVRALVASELAGDSKMRREGRARDSTTAVGAVRSLRPRSTWRSQKPRTARWWYRLMGVA